MSGSLDSLNFYTRTYSSSHTFTNRKVDVFRSKLAYNYYWKNNSKSSITGFVRSNSVKQNPSYRVKDDFKPWIPAGDPNLAHGEVNDNSFNSYGAIAQHLAQLSWLRSKLIIGSSIDYSPNTYSASYIRIHKSDLGYYESFVKTDSLLADYQADLVNIAGYAQLKVQPLSQLNIVGAIRFDNFNYSFDNLLGSNAYTSVIDGNNTFNQFTPKLGLTYNLNKKKGLYANFSQGFVPPQVTELYRGNKIPSLKPVYYNNYEIGGWATFIKNKGKLEFSIYKMDGRNEIISVLQNDGSRIKQNAGKTVHQGIEYGVYIELSEEIRFRVSGSNAIHKFEEFIESGNDFSGNRMPQAPSWTMNTQISYSPKFFNGFRASLEWQHIDEYYMDQSNSKMYDGFDIFNLRLGYTWKSIEVWSNAMNISNEVYATVARATQWGQSYSLGKPRNITIGIAYKIHKNN